VIELVGSDVSESNELVDFSVRALAISPLEPNCADASSGHSNDNFDNIGLPSYQHLRPSMRRQDQYPCEFDGIAALHCCFACTFGTATGENAATTQAANATGLICFLIIKDDSLLQSTHGDDQIGPFKNLHQFVENALVVVGARLEVFLQQALCFVDGLKNQLLISHLFLPIQCRPLAGKGGIKSNFGIILSIFITVLNVVFDSTGLVRRRLWRERFQARPKALLDAELSCSPPAISFKIARTTGIQASF
jgi:hypothetical protein